PVKLSSARLLGASSSVNTFHLLGLLVVSVVLLGGPSSGLAQGPVGIDVVLANSASANRICLGDNTGAFPSCSNVSADIHATSGAAAADLNLDTKADLVFSNFGQQNL